MMRIEKSFWRAVKCMVGKTLPIGHISPPSRRGYGQGPRAPDPALPGIDAVPGEDCGLWWESEAVWG
ncbi:hypothetical protein CCACVL1_11674 [Corchorus capsularis]|uniref:Uncharacterized protein n=1 Tax=Corchorus capsularis TaxID=210143 RepID=A0A1R3IK00_COCAP|nr:hypothetical protein CCACVL1_11674 [Corchorus capsularis]